MATPNGTRERTRDEALSTEMREVSREIATLEGELRKLYRRRLRSWQRAVRYGWQHARIALASGATEVNVTQQLRRARLGRR